MVQTVRACPLLPEMLLRIRVASFLAGFGLAGSLALLQLRNDVRKSHELLSQQV